VLEVASDDPTFPPNTRRPRAFRTFLLPIGAAAVVVTVALTATAMANRSPVGNSSPGTVAAPPSGDPGSPELGRITVPAGVRDKLTRYQAPGAPVAGSSDQVDLLAFFQGATGTLRTVGLARNGGLLCWSNYIAVGSNVVADSACADAADLRNGSAVSAQRNYSVASPIPEFISGRVPAGATSVTLLAADGRTATIRTYAAGASWNGARFFVAAWPTDPTTTIRALSSAGNVVAVGVSEGLDRS
jgi:hypothetical protein